MSAGVEKTDRKKVEKAILEVIDSMDSSKFNHGLYVDMFKRLTDKEFFLFKERLRTGEDILQIVECKGTDKTIGQLIAIAKKLNIPLFHRVKTKIPGTGRYYMGTPSFKVLDMIVRRASQDGSKGLSVAKNTKKRNPLTGQTTGESKGVGLTLPEIKIINAKGNAPMLEELLSFRSGDLKARAAADAYLDKYGMVRLTDLQQYYTVSGATKLIANLFKGALIKFSTVPITKK